MPFDTNTCPPNLRALFASDNPEIDAQLQSALRGELVVEAGEAAFRQGESLTHLFAVTSGMGLRLRDLDDSRRKVLNFVQPGDVLGLQTRVMGDMRYGVVATTRMTLCRFDRSSLWTVFRTHPERAFALTYQAALEEHLMGEALSQLGQHGARERIAWSLHRFFTRARDEDRLNSDGSCPFPFRQQDLADALGLSLVHTNKTLAAFKAEGILHWSRARLRVRDEARLARAAMAG